MVPAVAARRNQADVDNDAGSSGGHAVPEFAGVVSVVGKKRARDDDEPKGKRKRSVGPAVNNNQTAIGFDIAIATDRWNRK